MIFCLVKIDAGALLQVPQHFLGKIDMPVQPRPDCRSPKRQLTQDFDRFLRPFFGISNLLRVPGKFLSQPDRGGVH